MLFKSLLPVLLLSIISIECSKLPNSCGTNSQVFNEFSWRIVGGQTTAPGEWPWQVAMKRLVVDGYYGGMCGGTIINERWILTAAHCVHNDPKPENYRIYMGYNDLNKLNGNELIHSVDAIVKHEHWNYTLKEFDIALVKMNKNIDFVKEHKFLHPICLPNITNELKDKCYSTGFGYQDQNGTTSEKLMKVSEPVYNITECEMGMNYINKDRNICAGGGSSGGLGTCTGDSGGPLQCQSNDGKWYQIGITSWGWPCAHEGVPDVFTRVAYFRNWIEGVLAKY